ncbi:MAG: DUF983 domain-containing protein [Alphaproteobacteria bacterium]|nr:DUF983 domain-containing protein [Alphaproteobacteria bacterium]
MTLEITHADKAVALRPRSIPQSMLRGAAQKCPACGEGNVFSSYLKVNDACPSCSEELHHQRADDAPPYFTMMIVGHIVVALVLLVEDLYAPALWVHAALWAPMILVMSLWLLPRVKGALIGLQWAMRMHGFSGKEDEVFSLQQAEAPKP